MRLADPTLTRQEALPLRCALLAFALGAVLVQFLVVPRLASGYAQAYPEVAYLAPPYVTALMVALACFEAGLLAAWLLVSAVVTGTVEDRAVSGPAKRWVNVLAASVVLTAVILAGICANAGFVENIGGPAMLFGLLVCLALVPAAFALRSGIMGWLEANAVR